MSLLLNLSAPLTPQWQGNSVTNSKLWILEFSASWIASESWTGKTSTCRAHWPVKPSCQSSPAASQAQLHWPLCRSPGHLPDLTNSRRRSMASRDHLNRDSLIYFGLHQRKSLTEACRKGLCVLHTSLRC